MPRQQHAITRKKNLAYWPSKYYKGLSWTKKAQRHREIKRFGSMDWKNPRAYKGFQTDKGVVTKKSSYVEQWNKIFPGVTDTAEKAKNAQYGIEDLRGGTFTISNLGAIGGTYSTPIINWPTISHA
jgi:hypothetical protein